MNLVLDAHSVRICSKFSVKCEATHKNIVILDFLMLVTFKEGELAHTGKYYIDYQ